MSREAFAWAGASAAQAESLAGDASSRSYYRLRRGEASTVLRIMVDLIAAVKGRVRVLSIEWVK